MLVVQGHFGSSGTVRCLGGASGGVNVAASRLAVVYPWTMLEFRGTKPASIPSGYKGGVAYVLAQSVIPALTDAQKAIILKTSVGDAAFRLCEINHSSFSSPYRFASDVQDVIHDGNVYSALAFAVSLPAQRLDQVSRVTLTLDNSQRVMIAPLRTVPDEPTVTLRLVLLSDPANTVGAVMTFKMENFRYVAEGIECSLLFDRILEEPFPGNYFTPDKFPGLFGGNS